MLLPEYLHETTHRLHRTYLAWLDAEINRPSRADAYAMQIAAEVRRVLAKNPGGIKLSDFILRTKDAPSLVDSADVAQHKKNLSDISRATWKARFAAARRQYGG